MNPGQSASLPHVEIMILNYNGEKYLETCLSSLEMTSYPDFSITLIDNNSTDDSLSLVRSTFPRVAVIENFSNLGFGQAYDQAIRASKNEFIVLLNNDTQVDPNWLHPLVAALQADEKLAAVSAKLLFLEHPWVINHAGGGMNCLGLGYDQRIFDPDDQDDAGTEEVFFPTGAACLMRKSVYAGVNGFDPSFFMYHEDVDLGWRLQLSGYRVCSVSESRVYHAFGGSSLHSSGMSFRNNLGYRHALRSLIKNYEMKNLVRTLPLLLVLGLRSFWRDRSILFFRCLAWNFVSLPSTLRQRRAIQKSRVQSDAQVMAKMWPNLQLPVYFPDYHLQTRQGFSRLEQKGTCVRMQDTDSGHLGFGWYAPDWMESLQVSYRWSRKKAVVFLWNEHEQSRILIQAVAMAGTLKKSRDFSLYLNGSLAKNIVLTSDGREYIELDYQGSQGLVELELVCTDTWRPDDVFGNKDYRDLGLGVIRIEVKATHQESRPYSGISVIVPTYNRCERLKDVLRALENQNVPQDAFEVIVVDDGSTDETQDMLNEYLHGTSMQIRCLRQENKKQGAARNYGLSAARMPLVAFIGDDIVPEPDFLASHLCRHNAENLDGTLAVIGHTKWPQGMKVTPFMEFIHDQGYQFGFSVMEDRNELPYNFFYTSNISLSKRFLQRQEVIFDESFETYGWEDIELGYRLERQGMRLCLEHQAIAYHHHRTDVRSFYARQFNVGKSSRIFVAKHPELRSFLGDENLGIGRWNRSVVRLLAAIVHKLDQKQVKMPQRLYHFILRSAYALGAQSSDKR